MYSCSLLDSARGRSLSLEWTADKLGPIMLDPSNFQVKTDNEGRFIFTKVPPDRLKLVQDQMWPLMAVEVKPGETAQVALSNTGCKVSFNLRVPDGIDPRNILAVFNPVITIPMPDGRESIGSDPIQMFD